MNPSRRRAVRALVAASLAPAACAALGGTAVASAIPVRKAPSPINVIMPRAYEPPAKGKPSRMLQARLGRAVLDAVNDRYKGRTLPVWRRPHGSMDLEKRIMNICYWIVESVREHAGVYPVDPAWVAAQIMTESFFKEFAVSRALAVGICQFIPPTAAEFGMTCAGTRPAHAKPPYARHDWAGEMDRYYDVRAQWKKAIRHRNRIAGDQGEYLRTALADGLQGKPAPKAQQWMDADAKAQTLDAQVKEARQHYRDYLAANFENRSIFNDGDVAFFKAFEERVLYHKPVKAMVLMLARFLRARSGNILSAAAGYHCGLAQTREDGDVYGPYGRLPGIDSTVSYVSRILVHHHEIALRMA